MMSESLPYPENLRILPYSHSDCVAKIQGVQWGFYKRNTSGTKFRIMFYITLNSNDPEEEI